MSPHPAKHPAADNADAWDPDHYYNVSRWGDGFFHINDKGNLCVLAERRVDGPTIDISEVIEEMIAQKIEFPAVIRFQDILRAQVKNLNKAFRNAIEDNNYRGRYCGVFPIKVNQMREVVEEVVDAGAPYDYGLEAGSKPELLTVLAYNTNRNSLTVLNGYKDRDFMRLALLANKLGRKCILVIENFSEVAQLISVSKEMGIKPMVGLRAKLAIQSKGKWASSSGDRAKFGLTLPEIVSAVRTFKDAGMSDCLKLLHFHIGSQIADIAVVKQAVSEGARIYAKLHKMGCALEYFDAGGGLAVDYDGTRSTNDSSRNYRVDEYAADIVHGLKQICDQEGVPHPNIVTESGRAITAHHSCVITNVVDTIRSADDGFDTRAVTGEHMLVTNMRESEDSLNGDNFQEVFNDVSQIKGDSNNAFKLGILTLEERAKIEAMYFRTIGKIARLLKTKDFVPEDLQGLESLGANHYLCNFSVFQSTADIWAIDQILPVVPISRLHEEPTENCSLVDITCDSDGKIDQFINGDGIGDSLRLHSVEPGKPYYVGLFLTGAYQDVMGDSHNLFGRLNEVHVYADDDDPSDFYIEEIIRGSSSESVLATMQYHPTFMAQTVKKEIDRLVTQQKLPPREAVKLSDFYEKCLKDYTYLKIED
ncbi:MAG: hypothetical protein RL095_1170 [Verrucomicrobiota bacterium]